MDEVAGVDHHCHGVLRADPDRDGFEQLLTEADAVSPLGGTLFDSMVGLAVRARCAPVLDLEPHASPEAYLRRRAELGAAEVNRRFLRATGSTDFLVDTGIGADRVTGPAELAELSGARAHEVLRLETLAERVADERPTAAEFADLVRGRLHAALPGIVAAKSIAAYRVGLALAPRRPGGIEVRAAAGRLLARADGGGARIADEVLHRFLIWEALDAGLPVQLHAGYGDADLDLHRSDPLLLTGLLRATEPLGVPVMLLHNYPFHRGAGYLAQVFGHVFCDTGLAIHNLGRRSAALIAESLELAPLGKVLFSTDAYGLAEHYYLGTTLFRDGLGAFLDAGISDGSWSAADAERIATMIASGNARRAYRLGTPPATGAP